MEEVDKGCPVIRMGVSGRVFLLVQAYPGSPGPKAVKRLYMCVCVCVCQCVCVCYFYKNHYLVGKKTQWFIVIGKCSVKNRSQSPIAV